MKKIRILLFGLCALFFLTLNTREAVSADLLDVSRPLNVKFYAKFVYPDGTPVPTTELKLESKISYAPHQSFSFMAYQLGTTEILRNTQTIPNVGNGVYSDSYTSKKVSFRVIDQRNKMEGGRVSYNSLFAETGDCIKSITPIQKVGTSTITNYLTTGETIGPVISGNYVMGVFERTTMGLKKGFKYIESTSVIDRQYADTLDCLFATYSGSTTRDSSWGTTYTGIQFNENNGTATYAKEPITFRLDVPEIEETFVDTQGNKLSASDLHPSFVQDNKYYATGDDYEFGNGKNGQTTTLPTSYVQNGKTFEFVGMYAGDDYFLPAHVPSKFDWQHVPDADKDKFAKIRIVYKEIKTQYSVTGYWVDDTPEANLLPAGTSGIPGTNPGGVNVNKGDHFNAGGTATINSPLIDPSGYSWELTGWKNMTKSPNTLNTNNKPIVLNVQEDTQLHYIYKKIAPRLEINLTPDSTVIRKPGETIDWTLEIKNTGYKANATGLDLSHVITKTSGNMTNPSNTVIEDNSGSAIAGITNSVWTDGGTLLASKGVAIKPDEKITVKFKTTVTGDINDLLNLKTKVTATSDNLSAEDDTNVRIEDPDHHVVTDPADSKLSLLYVPTIFGFGYHEKNNNGVNQTVSMAAGAYQMKTVNEGFYVKLQDPRANQIGNDWKLSATLDYFIDSSGILLPMQPVLTLDNYNSQIVNNPETDTESISPTSDVSITSGTVSLTGGGGTIPLMNSQNMKNKGTWIFRIPFNDVKLHIPADVGEEGKGYTSELTWTLNDTI